MILNSLRIVAVGAVAVVLLTGCTGPTVVAGSEVTVAVAEPFTSLNPATSYGRTTSTNANVAYLAGASFAYYDDQYRLVDDLSFGTAEIIADDPLTVKYTVSPDARWSDGTPIDAADLLLAWAANSGALNTPDFDDSSYVDPATGRYATDFPAGTVYFNGAVGAGLEKATQTPQLGSDGRTLYVHYDTFVPAWKTLLAPGIPAHVLQAIASGQTYDDARKAKDDLIAAITTADQLALGKLARAWNDAYNVTATPADPRLLLSSGPYAVSAIDETGVTLDANSQYRGDRRPKIETIKLRYSPDELDTIKLLEDGDVDIITPEPKADTATTLGGIGGVTVVTGSESRNEHLDLQFADSRSGMFGDERIRRAFLEVVPRQQILEQLVTPLQSDATVLDSFVLHPGSVGYADAVAANGSVAYSGTDVAGATALLAEAGVTAPTVCILYDPASDLRQTEFALIRDSAARAGFVVTDCSSPDWQGLLGVGGAYDAALFAWDTSRLGPGAAGSIFRSDSTLANFSRYSDPAVDTLVDQLAAEHDPAKQAALATQIDTALWDAAYGVPLYAYPTLTAVRDTVTGVTRSPQAHGVFWDAWQWAPAPAG
ncbi:MAG: ABC transporter family substrate-binding protein [Pseudolysinimonas sp.]|uniref:ABC transporter family substrate-binding protein n=1 Tax=Pseudolysinimonas sp. TaxID=2680009 RepID=UPI003263D232